ncbi:S9 family peptidase [Prevotella brunnea]|uniref:S9 family peptidase n=1 Tax=Prevotella brunnea TaxID=2508867 RepID=A0A5C8GB14_9BACT|nr:S9 family peptidase [Prevotella brunnea]TXJ59064.1 S9 family peptidase [Prevotella brunnea]
MKKILFMCVTIITVSAQIFAGEPISLKDFTDNAFAAKRISGVNPLKGTSEYAQMSSDSKKIVKYSFKTGKETGVLFDVADTKGVSINDFEGYKISDDGRILIQTNTKRIYRRSYKADFYLYDIKNKTMKKLSEKGLQQIPTFSPDGKHIAFVRDNNIFITDGKTEKQITTDGKFNEIINGVPDWVNEEEFGFNNALAWSSDGKTLSWIRYDESKVKTYSLQTFMGSKPTRKEFMVYPGEYAYKYPKAGEDNSKVTVWAHNLINGKTLQYQLPLDTDGYVPRVKTFPRENQILIYTMNRHQDMLNLYVSNPLTGTCRLLIKENVPKYVKEEAMEGISIMKNCILLPSDRDGYMHLYLYSLEGKLIRQIEKGAYDVTKVYGYDEKTGSTYFQAAGKTPMQRETYVADKHGKVSCLSLKDGWNDAVFSGDYKFFLNTWSDRNHPYVYTIYDNRGKMVREVLNNDTLLANIVKYDIPTKEFFKFTTSEGIELNGWMMKPSDFDENKKYPVIMHQYSGPGSQQVVDSWSIGSMGNGGIFDAYLSQKGFIIVSVDGRGTGGRGAEFEKCIYQRLGDLESKDQVEAALWLGKEKYVDAGRIGIWGWSFGGFNTLMSMSEGRNTFKAGVSIAPPTNWRYYDTVYTERYMRTPQENPDGYATNPIERVGKLNGKLLICHGIADDNVHIQNAYEYSEALVQADKDFKENFYTNRNHSIYGGNTRNHLLRQVAEWFINNL